MADERRLWSALRGAARRVRGDVAPTVGIALRDTRTALSYASHVAALRRDLGDAAADGYADLLRRLALEDVDASRRVAQVLHQELYRVGAERRSAFLVLVALPLGRLPGAIPVVVEVAAALLESLDPEAARAFVERGLAVWGDGGAEKGEQFLRRRSFEGISTLREARGGVLLADLRGMLTFYARAHLGRSIGIRALPEGRTAYADPDGLWLPERVAVFGDARDLLVYRVMTAICTGTLEYGSLTLDLDAVPGAWPSRVAGESEVERLARSTSVPFLARDLFQVVEDRRIERRVRGAYPGIARDIDALRAMRTRRLRVGRLPLAAQLVEALGRQAWHLAPARDLDPRVRDALEAWDAALERATGPEGTVADVAALVPDLVRVCIGLGAASLPAARPPPTGEDDDATRSLSELAASFSQRADRVLEPPPLDPAHWPDLDLPLGNARLGGPTESDSTDDGRATDGGPAVGREADREDELLGEKRKVRPDVASFGPVRGTPVAYPEWDWRIDDYKARWARVYEHDVPILGTPFVAQTRLRHRVLIQRLRHAFEALKPEDVRRRRGLVHGDELDMDAVIEARVVARAGGSPPERLYQRRERAVRDVTVGFLLDLSSSTSEMIHPLGRRIVDLGREALVVISEAVDAIGDPFGIFGFSGYGREHVAVWVAKDFDEVLTDRVRDRIGGLVPRMENRDGAAIRHLTRRLVERPARVRLLITISDGRPLDCGCTHYFEKYAQEDTRMAVVAARDQGVHPFCITVDPRGADYVSHMYGAGAYTVIEHVDHLPARLPALYRRLTR